MCGIIGFLGFDNANKLVLDGLKLIINRGKDGFGLTDNKIISFDKPFSKTKNCIGHNLHSVVNIVPQPLKGKDSSFVVNGEIYNWEILNEKYQFNAKNDSEVIFKLLEKKGIDAIDELEGVFSFAYWNGANIYIVRDIIGVKPLWFSLDEKLAFCSERKVLIKAGLTNVEELNPRLIIKYNIKTRESNIIKRTFFEISPEHKDKKEALIENVKELSLQAIKKRIPKGKFGILFSGGIDSTFIAYTCKKLGLDFTCYTASLKGETQAPDLIESKKVAKKLGLDLKYQEIELDKVPDYLKKVVPLIEDTNVVKVGVGLTFYIACELAKKDGIKVIFSGLGSEELFAGYDRHKKSKNVNDECLSGVRKIYERDLYRDDVITMNNNLELRLPFLDRELTEYALKIPAKYKLDDKQTKIILRQAAYSFGLKDVERPKKAAQYGSKFDKALDKLTKKSGLKYKSEYLKKFYTLPNLKIAALVSGGKDSWYALHILQKQNYEISCLIAMKSKNLDSYMYHTPNIDMVLEQAKAGGIPLILQETLGKKEEELEDLKKALTKAKEEYGIQGVCSGAIFSNYQRERIEKVCDELGLKTFSPLWHMNQELEMRSLIEQGFEFIFSSIAAEGLDKTWLGRTITERDIDALVKINQKIGLNIAGEGGEFESFVVNAPFFKTRMDLKNSEIVMENDITGRILIK